MSFPKTALYLCNTPAVISCEWVELYDQGGINNAQQTSSMRTMLQNLLFVKKKVNNNGTRRLGLYFITWLSTI